MSTAIEWKTDIARKYRLRNRSKSVEDEDEDEDEGQVKSLST